MRKEGLAVRGETVGGQRRRLETKVSSGRRTSGVAGGVTAKNIILQIGRHFVGSHRSLRCLRCVKI